MAETRNTANAINNTAKAQKNEVNNDIPLPRSAQKDASNQQILEENLRISRHRVYQNTA